MGKGYYLRYYCCLLSPGRLPTRPAAGGPGGPPPAKEENSSGLPVLTRRAGPPYSAGGAPLLGRRSPLSSLSFFFLLARPLPPGLFLSLSLSKERENSPFSLSTKQNGPVFQNRKTNAVFLFCFPSAMVLLAAGASPGAAPCNTPPPAPPPPLSSQGRTGQLARAQNKKLPARSSETLPLLVKKSNDTDLCQSRSSCSLVRR